MHLRPTRFRQAAALVFASAILLTLTCCTKKSSAQQMASADLKTDVTIPHSAVNAV